MITSFVKDTFSDAGDFVRGWNLEVEFFKLTGKTIEDWEEYPEDDDYIIEKLLGDIPNRTFIVEFVDENCGYFNIYEINTSTMEISPVYFKIFDKQHCVDCDWGLNTTSYMALADAYLKSTNRKIDSSLNTVSKIINSILRDDFEILTSNTPW
jgi:hypothetical protein